VEQLAQDQKTGIKEILNRALLTPACGMGYLTYAFNRRGYDCTGVDLSRAAVSEAKRRYGDHYYVSDVGADSGGDDKKYDVVVLTEVIEHVEDPLALLRSIGKSLNPGGEIILTTPNKDCYSADDVWNTDLPPVHLWWFSHDSLTELVARSGYTRCGFLDFKGCPKGFFADPKPIDWLQRQAFDESGRLSYRGHQKFSKILSIVNLAVDLHLQRLLFRLRPTWRYHVACSEGAEGKPSTICAVISGQSSD